MKILGCSGDSFLYGYSDTSYRVLDKNRFDILIDGDVSGDSSEVFVINFEIDDNEVLIASTLTDMICDYIKFDNSSTIVIPHHPKIIYEEVRYFVDGLNHELYKKDIKIDRYNLDTIKITGFHVIAYFVDVHTKQEISIGYNPKTKMVFSTNTTSNIKLEKLADIFNKNVDPSMLQSVVDLIDIVGNQQQQKQSIL